MNINEIYSNIRDYFLSLFNVVKLNLEILSEEFLKLATKNIFMMITSSVVIVLTLVAFIFLLNNNSQTTSRKQNSELGYQIEELEEEYMEEEAQARFTLFKIVLLSSFSAVFKAAKELKENVVKPYSFKRKNLILTHLSRLYKRVDAIRNELDSEELSELQKKELIMELGAYENLITQLERQRDIPEPSKAVYVLAHLIRFTFCCVFSFSVFVQLLLTRLSLFLLYCKADSLNYGKEIYKIADNKSENVIANLTTKELKNLIADKTKDLGSEKDALLEKLKDEEVIKGFKSLTSMKDIESKAKETLEDLKTLKGLDLAKREAEFRDSKEKSKEYQDTIGEYKAKIHSLIEALYNSKKGEEGMKDSAKLETLLKGKVQDRIEGFETNANKSLDDVKELARLNEQLENKTVCCISTSKESAFTNFLITLKKTLCSINPAPYAEKDKADFSLYKEPFRLFSQIKCFMSEEDYAKTLREDAFGIDFTRDEDKSKETLIFNSNDFLSSKLYKVISWVFTTLNDSEFIKAEKHDKSATITLDYSHLERSMLGKLLLELSISILTLLNLAYTSLVCSLETTFYSGYSVIYFIINQIILIVLFLINLFKAIF